MLTWFTPTVPLYLFLFFMTPADLGEFAGVDWRTGLGNGTAW
jgi:hypothetical protein